MTNLGYNNRWVRLIKDVLFVAVAVFIMVRGRILGFVLGLLFAYWYGRDAVFQAKAIWQEKTYKTPDRPADNPSPQAPAENGKITVTNLSDAKEVDFEKE